MADGRAHGRSLADFRIAGKTTPHGLWPAEEKLLAAALRGEACEIGDTLPDEAGEETRVRGAFVRFLLLGGDGEAPVHEKGIQLGGAFVDGDIDLESAGAFPLTLWRCRVAGELIGRNARLGRLNLQGSHIRGINCDGARVTGSVVLVEGFTAEGEVRFPGAEIDGQLACSKGMFKNAAGGALTFDGARVTGDVFLRNGFTAEGEVRFPGAEIGGQLDCSEGVFKNAGGDALNCDQGRVTGAVFLSDGFAAEGEVSFLGAEMGGQLNCSKGVFKNADGAALTCDQARITGSVFLSDGFAAEGEVRLLGAKIGGVLACIKGVFNNAGGDALTCDSAKVAGNVFLSGGFTAEGEVRFPGAEIGGELICQHGKFNNPGGTAFNCAQIRVVNSVYLSSGFSAQGAVNAWGADIGGDLHCDGGEFRYSHARMKPGQPIHAAYALNLGGAKVHATLWFDGKLPAVIEGSVNLADAYAGRLRHSPRSWPLPQIETDDKQTVDCVMKLDGFTYRQLAGNSPTDAATCKSWLLRQPPDHLDGGFRPQPFEQLIRVLRDMGHTGDARDIGFFKEYCRLHRPWRGKRKPRNPLVWLRWLAQWLFLEKALGHGYYPHRMVILAVAMWIGCGFIYGEAARQDLFAPVNPRVYLDKDIKPACTRDGQPAWTSGHCQLSRHVPEYTAFNPFVYSLDVILPIVSLRQEDDWQPLDRPFRYSAFGWDVELPVLRFLVWFETIFAWVWSLSLSAVATGVIKRD